MDKPSNAEIIRDAKKNDLKKMNYKSWFEYIQYDQKKYVAEVSELKGVVNSLKKKAVNKMTKEEVQKISITEDRIFDAWELTIKWREILQKKEFTLERNAKIKSYNAYENDFNILTGITFAILKAHKIQKKRRKIKTKLKALSAFKSTKKKKKKYQELKF